MNFLNYELFHHCESRDVRWTRKRKPLVGLLHSGTEARTERHFPHLGVNKHVLCGRCYFVPILHLPSTHTTHTHTHTHMPISLYPLPFSQFLTLCCWKGREDNQVATSMSSVHPLLPFTNETVSLSILATCQHSLMSTCSLGPISGFFHLLPNLLSSQPVLCECCSLCQVFPYFHPFLYMAILSSPSQLSSSNQPPGSLPRPL